MTNRIQFLDKRIRVDFVPQMDGEFVVYKGNSKKTIEMKTGQVKYDLPNGFDKDNITKIELSESTRIIYQKE